MSLITPAIKNVPGGAKFDIRLLKLQTNIGRLEAS